MWNTDVRASVGTLTTASARENASAHRVVDDCARIKKKSISGKPQLSAVETWTGGSSGASDAETLINSLLCRLISSVTTAHLPRARKRWTVAALDPITHQEHTRRLPVTPPHLVGLVGQEFGCNGSFQEFLIVLCLDCRSPVKAELPACYQKLTARWAGYISMQTG